jgi:hypothetical protein
MKDMKSMKGERSDGRRSDGRGPTLAQRGDGLRTEGRDEGLATKDACPHCLSLRLWRRRCRRAKLTKGISHHREHLPEVPA